MSAKDWERFFVILILVAFGTAAIASCVKKATAHTSYIGPIYPQCVKEPCGFPDLHRKPAARTPMKYI